MDHNFWNDKFSQTPGLYGELPNEFLKANLGSLPAGKILLPGEGEGRNALYAASLGWQVTAIDQSETAKVNCLQKAEKQGLDVDYKVCNVTDYFPKPASFDVISLVYFHLPKEISQQIYTKFEEALEVGGKLIIEGFGKNQLQYQSGGPKNPDMLYDLTILKSMFATIRWDKEFDGIIHLEEGNGHHGDAHVIRLFGEKINI
ncbi:methyltransferase domain-containing protein [Aquiflexum sp. TKW24L]|uniref:class I SAM-dependent methyltransferase n=1 Tax=Aquiflexum sp. TKW24L TaxID=2942212 RepID=UPI0020BDC804|nr:methyltransferase domain-containing protein [Aquiflexum sp. TKW24L]